MKISIFPPFFLLLIAFGFPGTLGQAYSQETTHSEVVSLESALGKYHNLNLKKVPSDPKRSKISLAEEVEYQELTEVEQEIVLELGSHWAWPGNTLKMIDSYSPFLFRTKKSRVFEEVKVLLYVNEKGRVSGFDMVSEVDRGLEQRLDHMIRKLPSCKPVPGFNSYGFETFELTISK